MFVFKFLAAFAVCTAVSGFMFDDPCNVFPNYSGGIPQSHDFTTSVNVPSNCRNGTFRWDYPRGHAILQFHNSREEAMSICIRDNLGGDVFTITETTSHKVLRHFDYEHWACTDPLASKTVVLKVDAPYDLLYMGAFEYRIENR